MFKKECILYCENVLQSVMQGIFRSLSPEGLALWTLSDRHDTVFLNERMLMWWRSHQTDLVSVLLLVNRTPPSTKPAGVCRICSRKTWESNLSSGQCSSLFSHLLIEWRCQTGRDIKVRLKWFEVSVLVHSRTLRRLRANVCYQSDGKLTQHFLRLTMKSASKAV